MSDLNKTGNRATRPLHGVVSLRLTRLEAQMLDSVAGNGWGDGDFAGWLGDKQQSQACSRAMRKLRKAIEQAG